MFEGLLHLTAISCYDWAINMEHIMANFKYFCDIDGRSIAIAGLTNWKNKEVAEQFPNVKAMRADGYSKWMARAADGRLLPVTHMIEYKARPSLHECNAKCLNGKHNGKCECQCGGKNHGTGMFSTLLM